jgi:hypothetical protein
VTTLTELSLCSSIISTKNAGDTKNLPRGLDGEGSGIQKCGGKPLGKEQIEGSRIK